MQTLSLFVHRYAAKAALLVALVTLACAVVAVIGIVSQAVGGIEVLPPAGLRLAPFRWIDLPTGVG